jgi:hypothetical protein
MMSLFGPQLLQVYEMLPLSKIMEAGSKAPVTAKCKIVTITKFPEALPCMCTQPP